MEKQKCLVQGLKLTVTHNFGFRPGETAEVVGVVMVTPDGHDPRLCYAARYADGFVDYKPCDGAGDWYELTPNIEVQGRPRAEDWYELTPNISVTGTRAEEVGNT